MNVGKKEKMYPYSFLEWVRKNCEIIDLFNDRWWQFTDPDGWIHTECINGIYDYWYKNITHQDLIKDIGGN